MVNDMEKLKPCPFCGGEAVFNIYSNSTRENNRGWSYDVHCEKCGAFVPNRCSYETIAVMDRDGNILLIKDNRDKAIEAWNRRVEG